MSEGSVSWSVIGMYIKSVGWTISGVILLSLVLMQLSQNLTFLWLSYWVSNRNDNTTSLENMPHGIGKSITYYIINYDVLGKLIIILKIILITNMPGRRCF